MKLDRTSQRELLEELATVYPDRLDWRDRLSSTGADGRARMVRTLPI